jgi:hypothetical protein
MTGTLAETQADIQNYANYDEVGFVAQIPGFIRQSEERIWYTTQLPFFRKAQTGSLTASNQYLQLPSDFLAAASLAVVLASGEYVYLLNKDVEYVREVYPNPNTTGVPYCYALFDVGDEVTNILIGPTPDLAYDVQLNYFYRPSSLADAGDDGTTWLSTNAYDALLYGALCEAATYLKKTTGIVDAMADEYEKRFVSAVAALKNLGESRDRKDTYRAGEVRRPEAGA